MHPVNSIMIWYDNEDHSDYLGFTWQKISNGRSLVGIDESDVDFNTIGKTGGEKQHTLTTDEVLQLDTSGILSPVAASNQRATEYSGPAPVGHNNLSPYLVVAFWVRTA